MDYKLIYKPSTTIRSHNTNHKCNQCVWISSLEIVCLWCTVDGSSVPLLPVEIPFPMRTNNRQLLEKPITLKQKGIFTIAMFCYLASYGELFDG